MDKGQIPWYSIIRWCKFYGIDNPDTIERFIHHIRGLEYEKADFDRKKRVDK